MMANVEHRKSLPQAVPNSICGEWLATQRVSLQSKFSGEIASSQGIHYPPRDTGDHGGH